MMFLSAMQSMSGNMFSKYAEFAAYRMLLKTVMDDVIPASVRARIWPYLSSFVFTSSKLTTIVIEQQSGMSRNVVFESAETYLGTKISPTADRFKLTKNPKQKGFSITMEKGQIITDVFRGNIKVEWRLTTGQSEYGSGETRLELTFDQKHHKSVLNDYLPFVMKKADEIRDSNRTVRLYTKDCPYASDDSDLGGNPHWGCVNLDHPATFDKIAMEPVMKKGLIEDLDRFLRRKDYYKKVGKAWKRGYLLYGPPGTGKSSLIAAIANYLQFDIYDLELASLTSDADLRRIMLSTTNRSIIVIEDIDCSVNTLDRENHFEYSDQYSSSSNTKFTLSGLLNFIDGLWSCCGDERIIIFTTNHKEKLDPALLRPGRMDMHIHLSYCTPAGFRTLASNYLGVDRQHNEKLFDEIEWMIESCEVTPAVIAEELMRSEDADLALQGVKALLHKKMAAAQVCKDGDEEEEEKGEEEEEAEYEVAGRKRKSPSRGRSVRGGKYRRCI